MKATKIEIQGETRIKIDFPYNRLIAEKLKSIPGAVWSKTLGSWHIPYNKDSFQKLIEFFPETEYPRKHEESSRGNISSPFTERNPDSNKNVLIRIAGRRILVKLPKDNNDILFIRNLRYSRWDQKQLLWIIPHYPGNLDLLKNYFRDRITGIITEAEFAVNTVNECPRTLKNNQLLMIKTQKGRVKLIFGMNQELILAVKKIPFHQWDSHNKWWTIPFSDRFCKEIRESAIKLGLEIMEEEEHTTNRTGAPRISKRTAIQYRTCPEEYTLKLKELRYSEKTVKIYKSLFEEFINFYKTYDIKQIDEKMIIAFLQYLVIERKVSESYQNQSINSIKFYYERVLGGQRRIYLVERPRRDKKLPVVLSEAEVTKAIKTINNLKHRAIVMVIYSGGLRISEALNLKITDIDSKRMQIFIRNAKGGKDRYTLLSKKVVPVLQEYYKLYRPRVWLFEGLTGQQYSESSIGAIVKKAFHDAGIRKQVSTHTLRHCFATHLLENGTDLRYIQTLLGHASSKTTEIYTHMTTKGFDQIVNPMDKFDI